MRQIKLKTTMAGPEGCFYPGQIISVEDDLAGVLVAGGYGEYAGGGRQEYEQGYETAAVEPPEKAVAPRRKPRKAVK